MIKKIIFDMDNTLIEWKKEYISAYINSLNRFNIDYNNFSIKSIDNVIKKYELSNNIYSKEKFLNFININYKVSLPIEFINTLLEEQTKCYEDDKELIDTLEYLSKKYELIVITNWFTYTQKERLKNAKILEYFKYVTGGDEHELKPSLKAFNSIENPSECVMVGDSIKCDMTPALKLGMGAILLNNKNVRKDLRYKKISNINELKEML